MPTDPGSKDQANQPPDRPIDAQTDRTEDTPLSSHLEGEEASSGPTAETPTPALAGPATPAPSLPKGDAAEEDTPGAEEIGSSTNLAYEDMLAKLALATSDTGAEPKSLASKAPSSPPESVAALPSSTGPIAAPPPPSWLATPPHRLTTLVNPSPLSADDEDPTIPGRGKAFSAHPPIVQAAGFAPSQPLAAVHGGTRSRLLHLMLGGMLVLGGMLLAVLVLKLLMPTPAPESAPAVAPAPLPPPPTYAPSIRVEPLPAGTPSAVMPAVPAESPPPAVGQGPAASGDGVSAIAPGQAQPRLRKTGTRSRPPRLAPPPAAPELAAVPKSPSAGAPSEKKPTPPVGKESGKSSAYHDPFE